MNRLTLLNRLCLYPSERVEVLFKTGGIYYPIADITEESVEGKTVLVLQNVIDPAKPRVM